MTTLVSGPAVVSIVPRGPTALEALTAGMAPGQWASFAMGGMGLALLDAGTAHSITEFSARGHWDPVHRKIQYWGQGHWAGEKLITWDDATNQWSVGTPPAFGGIGHAYYHLALDPATGDLYLRGYSSAAVKKKPYGGAWTNIASMNNTANQVAGALEWFGGLNGGSGGLLFADQLSAETYSPTTNAWTVRSTALSIAPYHNWAAAAGGYVYFGGGNGSTTMYRMTAAGSIAAQPPTPVSAGVNNQGIVMSHPNGNDLLLFVQGTTGPIHRFNGNSWVSHGTHQIGGATSYWFGVPISTYGLVLFVAQTGSTSNPVVKVYKP